MSTAHIYGDPPEVVCTEESPFGFGLAPFVARAWEAEFQESFLPAQLEGLSVGHAVTVKYDPDNPSMALMYGW